MNAVKIPYGSYLIWNDDKGLFATPSRYWGNIHKAGIYGSRRKAREWIEKCKLCACRVVNQYEAVRAHYASLCEIDGRFSECRPAIAYLYGESLDGRGSRIGNTITFLANQEDHLFFPDLAVGATVQLSFNPKTGVVTEVSPCVKTA